MQLPCPLLSFFARSASICPVPRKSHVTTLPSPHRRNPRFSRLIRFALLRLEGHFLPTPMLAWQQIYNPTGNLFLSAAIASIAVVVLLALLAIWHVRAHWAALVSLSCAAGVAILVYGMPVGLVFTTAGYGAAFGLFPIGWIVLNAIFI